MLLIDNLRKSLQMKLRIGTSVPKEITQTNYGLAADGNFKIPKVPKIRKNFQNGGTKSTKSSKNFQVQNSNGFRKNGGIKLSKQLKKTSPERNVWTAQSSECDSLYLASSPPSPASFPRQDSSSSSSSSSAASCSSGSSSTSAAAALCSLSFQHLSNLEQLAEISLAAGYRSLPSSAPPSPPSCWLAPLSEPDGTHVCPECGKRYSTSSNLARHRQTHRSVLDKKARKCPHCDKVYVSMPAFSMHVRTHSQGCRCSFCGKCFSRPWLLNGHIRTHTGEKPFKCPVCNKAFADKSNLRAHIQTHSDTKPFICGRCGKAFALKSYLYKHEESSCMRVQRHDSKPKLM